MAASQNKALVNNRSKQPADVDYAAFVTKH